MMKRILSLLMCLLLATGTAALAEEAAQTTDYTTGTPWMDPEVLGNVTEDTPAELNDNFALYVNKEKILTAEMPAGVPMAGPAINAQMQMVYDMVGMYMQEAPQSHDAQLAYNLYWMMMDWDSRNAAGVEPAKKVIDEFEAISSIEELSKYAVETPAEQQLYCAWKYGGTVNPNDSSSAILAIMPMVPLLEDAGEYAQETQLGALMKEAEGTLAQKMLVKLGYTEEEAAAKYRNCLEFEGMLASAMYPDSVKKTPEYVVMINNFFTPEEVKELEGNVPILEMINAAGYPEMDQYMVSEPEFIRKLNELWTEENLTMIKDCFIVHGSRSFIPRLDHECYEWMQEYQSTMAGTSGAAQPDEMVFSTMVSELLKWPVAQLYTERYLEQDVKDRIARMVDEIQEAYHGILNEADWLSEETRAKAVEKLEAIQKNVLYPDNWDAYSYEDLDFAAPQDGGTLWDAYAAIDRYTAKKMVELFDQPLDRTEWPDNATPNTYNCFYVPNFNSVYILGAYVRGLGDIGSMSDEELYARLGVAIGHEFSHAFDPTGSQFDKDGNMNVWWTAEDGAAFAEKTARLAAFYSAIQPWEGQNYSGEVVTGEACADLAGMKVILRIAADKEGFDYDAFFRAYADNYMTVMTPEMALQMCGDFHPLNYLRVNVVLQHFDEFLNLYGIQEGDGMYLAPEDRVSIW